MPKGHREERYNLLNSYLATVPANHALNVRAHAHHQRQLRRGTMRLSDFLNLSFVFIDILGLFPRFCDRQVEESRSRGVSRRLLTCGSRTCGRRLVWHCATRRLFDLVLCFHRHSRFVSSNSSREVESRESKSEKPPVSGPRIFGLASQLLDFSTPQLLDCLFS